MVMGAYPLPVEETVHALSPFYQAFYYGGSVAGVAFFIWFFMNYIGPEVESYGRWLKQRIREKRD